MNDNLTPDQIAERDAHLVRSSDQLAREAAGQPDPEEGHDVSEWAAERWPMPEAVDSDRDALKEEIKAELLAELRDQA